MVVAFSNFPNKTCDLAAEKVSFSKFRFKSCVFGTTTPTANSECKNYNFWNPNPNHNFWECNSNPPYKFSKLCNNAEFTNAKQSELQLLYYNINNKAFNS